MTLTLTSLDNLKARAKEGDNRALQELRARRFFEDKKAGKVGYPVSNAQRRLWILEQMGDGSSAYNTPGAIILEGPLNTDAFNRALESIVKRHESLRTIFVNDGDEARQVIQEHIDFCVEQIDIREQKDPESLAKEYVLRETMVPFDLTKGPFIRAKLLRLGYEKYLFFFNIHHTVCDEWSIGVLIKESMALYKAYVEGESDPLPPLKVQYKDYSLWQNALLRTEEAAKHRRYWHKKLSGSLQVLNLPTDYPRPSILSFKGEYRSFDLLDNQLAGVLKDFSIEQNASLFMVLVGIVKVLLYHHTKEEDIIIGIPIAGRNHPDLEDQIGFYVNTLALRDSIKGKDTFLDVLDKVKGTASEAYEHSMYPFDLLVTELDVNRDMSHSPIFDVMAVLRNIKHDEFKLSDIKVTEFDTGFGVAKFDLIFDFAVTDDGLGLVIKYNTDLFRQDRITNMSAHLREILKEILKDASKPIYDINIIPGKELKQLLIDFNDTVDEFDKEKTIIDMFEEQVVKGPDNIAVFYENSEACKTISLTYSELNREANKISHHIRENYKIIPDDIICIYLERSPDMVACILGVLKAGGTCLLLDPEIPRDRIEFIIKDSDSKIVITNTCYIEQEQEFPCNVINCNQLPEGHDETNPEHGILAGNIAYIIYTSGTTGNPKGTNISHKSLTNYVTWIRDTFDFKPGDSSTWHASVSFDGGYACLWGTLLTGGTLHLISEDDGKDPEKMVSYLTRQNIGFLKITPSFFSMLLNKDRVDKDSFIMSDATGLKVVHIGGEEIIPSDVATYIGLGKNTNVINHYGPAEATIGCITYHIRPEQVDKFIKQPVIGKPILNTAIYILDDYGKPVPIGVFGEIHVAGKGLADGYINRPELTKERFISNPFDNRKFGNTLYKTGDMGRRLQDGNIEFIGRNDHQVKIRGFRIELGEIENRLIECKDIQDAVVIANNFTHDYNKELAAYIVSKEDLNVSELRNYLKNKLPDYMIPSYYVKLEKLPLTPNGKVDRNGLPDPVKSGIERRGKYVPPRNDMEGKVAKIWRDLLEIDKISIYDNFFELGGHSLKATVMVSRIQKDMGVKISLRDIFRLPTIAAIADLALRIKPTGFTSIPNIPEAESYPLSNSQRRLWVIDKLLPDKAVYNITGVNMLEGNIKINALERAFQELVKRHESLRTTFRDINGVPGQIIHNDMDFRLETHEIKNDINYLDKIVNKEVTRPFDLEKGPLFRASMYCIGENRHVFILNMHHIISDGWSIQIMIREFLSMYNAFCQGHNSTLEPLRIQYKDYSAWQNNFLERSEINIHREYWIKKFTGEIPVLNLPTDKSRPTVQSFRGDTFSFTIGRETLNELKNIGQGCGASTFITLVAVTKAFLYRYTGQKEIITGSPVAGRDHPDLEHQIGFYVNMIVLKDTVKGDDRFTTLLENVKSTITESFEHQVYPFDILVEELSLKRDMGRSPLFDVAISMRETENIGREKEKTGIKVSEMEIKTGVSKFDLTFFFTEMEDESLDISIEYSTDLFLPERIQAMAGHLKEIIKHIIKEPFTLINDLNMLTPEEANRILVEFNNTDTVYPVDKTVIELFEEQVQKRPDSTAIVSISGEITYKGLNIRANKIAHLLREKGVGQNQPIALIEERSIDMIVNIMGILKSGAAYVPVDIKNPPDRIVSILTDSKITIILTRQTIIKDIYQNLKEFKGEIMCLDKMNDHVQSMKQTNPDIINKPGDAIYIMYTSGSTGKPKGIITPHKGVVRLVKNTNLTNINPDDRLLQLASYAFDGSTYDIFGALLNGATLYTINDEMIYEPEEMYDFIQKNKINLTFIPTALFNNWIDTVPEIISCFDKIYFGGQEASVRHLKKALQYRKANDSLVNGYGPTEGTTFSTYYIVGDIKDSDTSIPIGKPLSNTRTYILGNNLKPVPIGIDGELYVGGDGVASGYLENHDLTKECFIGSPFMDDDTLYKTGDIVRWLPDGNIMFIGRRDEQVKIRGFRVEIGEIENTILGYDRAQKAFVMTGTSDSGNKELIAYVVAKNNLDIDDIRGYLSHKLPEYMIPSYFVRLDNLPINPTTGKVNRDALPDPSKDSVCMGSDYELPRDEKEEILVAIWQDILGKEKIGIMDDFFILGGDSIKAIRIASRLKDSGWGLEVRDIFHNPTIGELSIYLKPVVHTVDQGIITGSIPLTPIQKWFFEKHDKDIHHFNQAITLSTANKIDGKALIKALETLQIHHDILRVTYSFDNNINQINSGTDHPVFFEEVDLRTNGKSMEDYCKKLHRSFDLEKGPLIKTALFHTEDTDYIFIVIHHLIVDGISWRILIEDLERGYKQAVAGNHIELSKKTDSFKKWAEAMHEYSTSDTLIKEIEYWTRVESITSGNIIRDGEDQENLYMNSRSVSISLIEEDTESLKTKVHKAYTTEINDILLTGLGRAFKRWHKCSDTKIILEGHGRERIDINDDIEPDITRTIGWFTSIYPFVITIRGNDIGGHIKHVKDSLRKVPNKGVGYNIIRYITPDNIKQDFKTGHDSKVSFNYLGEFSSNTEGLFKIVEGVNGELISPYIKRHYDLNISGLIVNNKLNLSIIYNPDIHKQETVEKIISYFKEEIMIIIKHCVEKEVSEKTPTDYTYSDLSKDDYESILDKLQGG
ncbi:MAG: amino acid adenylation domain-containing protein [Colwellia sp.]|nr:amino acid adenylation domain-containing protein [Colwellia sp.]